MLRDQDSVDYPVVRFPTPRGGSKVYPGKHASDSDGTFFLGRKHWLETLMDIGCPDLRDDKGYWDAASVKHPFDGAEVPTIVKAGGDALLWKCVRSFEPGDFYFVRL